MSNIKSKWQHRALLLCFVSLLSLNLQAREIFGEVVAITDGDTLTVLDNEHIQHKIRLSGIDAPERRQPFGQQAREMLSSLVFHKQVEVLTHKTDFRRRAIGKVRVDGLDVSLALVTAGLAWHYKQYKSEQKPSDRTLYSQVEVLAREQRLGLWSAENPVPPWDWRRSRR